MKDAFTNLISSISLSWGKSVLAISLSLFILIFSYLLGNTSFPLPDEIGLFQKVNGWNSFWGVQKGNVPDSLLFINVCYDKELADYEENGIPVGKFVITDRKKLLHLLTQPNPDMLIIFAGYEKEMQTMLSTNIGLAGRFPYHYHFDDYSAEQLMEIACHLFEHDEYLLTPDAALEMQNTITQAIAQKPANFGNARWIEQFVRNGIIPAMADRIFSTGSNDFQHIEALDIVKAYEKFNPKVIELKPTRHRVKGFSA